MDYYECNEIAIDDDDDEGAWENSNCDSPGRKDGKTFFQRVSSKANLLLGRSLITKHFQTATTTDEQKPHLTERTREGNQHRQT